MSRMENEKTSTIEVGLSKADALFVEHIGSGDVAYFTDKHGVFIKAKDLDNNIRMFLGRKHLLNSENKTDIQGQLIKLRTKVEVANKLKKINVQKRERRAILLEYADLLEVLQHPEEESTEMPEDSNQTDQSFEQNFLKEHMSVLKHNANRLSEAAVKSKSREYLQQNGIDEASIENLLRNDLAELYKNRIDVIRDTDLDKEAKEIAHNKLDTNYATLFNKVVNKGYTGPDEAVSASKTVQEGGMEEVIIDFPERTTKIENHLNHDLDTEEGITAAQSLVAAHSEKIEKLYESLGFADTSAVRTASKEGGQLSGLEWAKYTQMFFGVEQFLKRCKSPAKMDKIVIDLGKVRVNKFIEHAEKTANFLEHFDGTANDVAKPLENKAEEEEGKTNDTDVIPVEETDIGTGQVEAIDLSMNLEEQDKKSEWRQAKEDWRRTEGEYEDALRRHYQNINASVKSRTTLSVKEFFGINPKLPDELSALRERYLLSKAHYARSLEVAMKKRADDVGNVDGRFSFKKEGISSAAAGRFVFDAIKRRQEIQRESLSQNEKLKSINEWMQNHKFGRQVGMVVVAGGVAAVTGGAGVVAGAMLGRAFGIKSGAAAAFGASLGVKSILGKGVMKAEGDLELEESLRRKGFSAEGVLEDEADFEKQQRELEGKKRRATAAAVTAGVAAGVAAGGAPSDSLDVVLNNDIQPSSELQPQQPEVAIDQKPEAAPIELMETQAPMTAEKIKATLFPDELTATNQLDIAAQVEDMDAAGDIVENISDSTEVIPEVAAASMEISDDSVVTAEAEVEVEVEAEAVSGFEQQSVASNESAVEEVAAGEVGAELGAYTVKGGDNLWDILENAGPNADSMALDQLIAKMESDSEFTKSVGIESGDPYKIFPGESIDVATLYEKLGEVEEDSPAHAVVEDSEVEATDQLDGVQQETSEVVEATDSYGNNVVEDVVLQSPEETAITSVAEAGAKIAETEKDFIKDHLGESKPKTFWNFAQPTAYEVFGDSTMKDLDALAEGEDGKGITDKEWKKLDTGASVEQWNKLSRMVAEMHGDLESVGDETLSDYVHRYVEGGFVKDVGTNEKI